MHAIGSHIAKIGSVRTLAFMRPCGMYINHDTEASESDYNLQAASARITGPLLQEEVAAVQEGLRCYRRSAWTNICRNLLPHRCGQPQS